MISICHQLFLVIPTLWRDPLLLLIKDTPRVLPSVRLSTPLRSAQDDKEKFLTKRSARRSDSQLFPVAVGP